MAKPLNILVQHQRELVIIFPAMNLSVGITNYMIFKNITMQKTMYLNITKKKRKFQIVIYGI